MEIKLLKGIKDYEFGLSKDSFLERNAITGTFDIIEEEEENKTESLYCEKIGTTLFFEGEETNMLFTSCETENKDSLLFGYKVFNMSESEIIKIMIEHGFTDKEEDIEEWGEKRISFFDAMVDFNFDEGKLISVSWGILIL